MRWKVEPAGWCAHLNVTDAARRSAQRGAHVCRPELQLLVADRRGERLQAQSQSGIRRRRSSSVLSGGARGGGGGGGGGGGVGVVAEPSEQGLVVERDACELER